MSSNRRLARAIKAPWPIALMLTVGMAGVILLVITVSTLLEIREQRDLFRQELEAQGRLLANTLDDALANALYFLDVDKVDDVTDAVQMSLDGLTYIRVFRPDGSLLTDTPAQNEPLSSLASGFVNSVLETKERVLDFRGDHLEVTSPVMAGNQILGIVNFDLSKASLDARLAIIVRDHVWQGLALLAVAILLAFAVARFVTKPLQALHTAALRIGRGDLDYQIPVGGTEETASLGKALGNMRTELKGLYQDLEGQVAERPQELSRTNESLRTEIVAHERAEEALQQSKNYNDNVMEAMHEALIVVNPDATVRMVNKATLNLLGYTQDELVGKSVGVIISQDFVTGQLQEILNTRALRSLDLTYRTKSGENLPVSFSGSAMRNPAGKPIAVVGIARDMRDMNHLQAQLVQAGKMAGLGQIGAGIAHELNQPITSIQGFAQRIRRKSPEELSDEVDIIINASHRMSRIVNNIRAFARQDEFNPEPTEAIEPLDDALMLLSEQLRPHGVEVEMKAEGPLPRINADETRLQQVFLNLLINAFEALDEIRPVSAKRLFLGVRMDRDQVAYTFEDTGAGVPSHSESRIFDPFFTTKPPGKGTGLSLSYGIVADHGGEITYRRAAGGGALFTVRIPVAPQNAYSGSEELVSTRNGVTE